jgi:uncharacterized protein (TIGR02300 family)
VAKPELGTKRLCPNCGAKYYDLNRDPIICPKCNALFATGVVAVTAAPVSDEEEDVETEDTGVEFVSLEDAVEPDTDDDSEDIEVGETTGVEVDVDADDAALIDDGDDDEVSEVVRGTDEDEEER